MTSDSYPVAVPDADVRLRSSIRSISTRDAELTNSETDLKPSSECVSMKCLMLKYKSSGIFTSLYTLAIDVIFKSHIKRTFDTYVERFINELTFRHVWRNQVRA